MYKSLYIMLIVCVLIICVPFITIWSINTLFLTEIPYNSNTWLAAAILSSIMFGNKK